MIVDARRVLLARAENRLWLATQAIGPPALEPDLARHFALSRARIACDALIETLELAQIRELQAEGLTYSQIGERLGLKESHLRGIVSDPDGSKDRARKARYGGTICGGPTDGSNGRDQAPGTCKLCLQGVPMHQRTTPSEPSLRRNCPIRLRDIPEELRLEGAREANRIEHDARARREILLAAIFPSDTVYWVAPTALATLQEHVAA